MIALMADLLELFWDQWSLLCFKVPDGFDGWSEISTWMTFSMTPPGGRICPICSHCSLFSPLTLITALCVSQQSLSHTHCTHLITPAIADACFSIRCALGVMTFRPNPWRLWKQIIDQPESLGRNDSKSGKATGWLTRYTAHLSFGKARAPKSLLIVKSEA